MIKQELSIFPSSQTFFLLPSKERAPSFTRCSSEITQGYPWLAFLIPPIPSHRALSVYLKKNTKSTTSHQPSLLPSSSNPSLSLPWATALDSHYSLCLYSRPLQFSHTHSHTRTLSLTHTHSSHSLHFKKCITSRSLAQKSFCAFPSHCEKIQTSYKASAHLPTFLSSCSPRCSLQISFLASPQTFQAHTILMVFASST